MKINTQTSQIAQQSPLNFQYENSNSNYNTNRNSNHISNLNIKLNTIHYNTGKQHQIPLSNRNRQQNKPSSLYSANNNSKRQSLKNQKHSLLNTAETYITHQQTKQYQRQLILQCKKMDKYSSYYSLYQDDSIQNNQFHILSGKYVYQNGKQYIRNDASISSLSASLSNLIQTQNKLKKINNKSYLIDIPINNIVSSHKILIQIILPCAKQFQLFAVDRNGKPINKFKFSVLNKYKSTVLKVLLPVKDGQYKIWKELDLPTNGNQQKIALQFEQSCSPYFSENPKPKRITSSNSQKELQLQIEQLHNYNQANGFTFSGCIVSINHIQFKLPLNNLKSQQFYYMLNFPLSANLLKIQLEKSVNRYQRDSKDCQCQASDSCIIM